MILDFFALVRFPVPAPAPCGTACAAGARHPASTPRPAAHPTAATCPPLPRQRPVLHLLPLLFELDHPLQESQHPGSKDRIARLERIAHVPDLVR